MLEIRPARDGDLDAVHNLLDRRDRALLGLPEATRDDLLRRWRLPGFAGWVAADGGRVVGYASLDTAQELEHVAELEAAAGPLLDAALRSAAARGFESVTVVSAPKDEKTADLVRRRGFRLDRTILRMWRAVPAPPPAADWPAGVAVRTYEPGDASAVKALLDRAYRGWDEGYVQRTDDDWLAFMTNHDEFDPALWFLAERDGTLAGCALHWRAQRGRGWLKDLVVDEPERGRGLGRSLLHHGLGAYAERGVERVGLKMDASNPTGAAALYERTGFAVDRRYQLWRGRV